MWKIMIVAVLCTSSTHLSAQAPSKVASDVHIRTIELQVEKEIQLDPQLGGGLALPIQCGPDGKIYARFVNRDGSEEQMVSIAEDGKTTRFSLPQENSVRKPVWMAQYVTDDSLVGHIKAQSETKWVHLKTSTGKDIGNREIGPMADYLFTFALDGKFKGRVKLDLPFEVLQAAPFPSGMILAAGIDSITKSPILALANENGSYSRPIVLQGDLSSDNFKPDPNALAGMGTFEAHLENSSLVPDGPDILLVRNETDAPVFVVRQSGQFSAVQIKAPDGYKVFSITPTRDGWITQFVHDLGHGGVLPTRCLVDRKTGALMQCYQADISVGLGFACSDADGTLSFLRGGTKQDPNRSSVVIAGAK